MDKDVSHFNYLSDLYKDHVLQLVRRRMHDNAVAYWFFFCIAKLEVNSEIHGFACAWCILRTVCFLNVKNFKMDHVFFNNLKHPSSSESIQRVCQPYAYSFVYFPRNFLWQLLMVSKHVAKVITFCLIIGRWQIVLNYKIFPLYTAFFLVILFKAWPLMSSLFVLFFVPKAESSTLLTDDASLFRSVIF